MDQVEVVVIGAGVIGLAIARAAALRGYETLVVESNLAIGMGISSRNSEVIHAGLYYPPDSLKAVHCLRGKQRLYEYCQRNDVPFRKTGKLIVASCASEEAQLEVIARRAQASGVSGADALVALTPAQVRRLEPDIACTAALLSPSTGIVDSHAFMTRMMTDAEAAGALFSFGTRIDTLEPGPPHRLRGISQGECFELAARHVIVAAGLHSAGLARASGLPAPKDTWLKGNYFILNRRGPFKHLIYPVPVQGGLGVHVTLDMGGETRFGPDTEPVESEDYRVDAARQPEFEAAIRRYWPGLPDNALHPGYAGIRPKLHSASGAAADFVIHGPSDLGIDGIGVLHGIESPGLTASLSLADAVCDAVLRG